MKSLATSFLQRDFEKRRRRNPAYSLRAYSRDLNISVSLISEILGGKRHISLGLARRILPHLALSPGERGKFLKKVLPKEAEDFFLSKSVIPFKTLDDSHFRIIAEWEHFAILSLLRTDDFRPSPRWIAQRLGVPEDKIELALFRLQAAGLIKKAKGTYRRVESPVTTSTGKPSLALRRGHKQLLEQAIRALMEMPVPERHITSTTIAMSPARLEEAKHLINEFHRSFAELIEDGPRTEVYNLNVQLVPVTVKRT